MSWKRIKEKIDRYFFAKGNDIDFSVARVLFFSLFSYVAWKMNAEAEVRTWLLEDKKDFWEPISFYKWLGYDLLSYEQLSMLLVVCKVSLVCCILGFRARFFGLVAFLSTLYLVGFQHNFGKVHHAWHMPVMLIGVLSFSRYPGRFSVDHLLSKFVPFIKPQPKESAEYTWPVKAIWIYVSCLYFAAGFQKLRTSGLDWIFSDNMATIILTRPFLPELGEWVAQFDLLCRGIALATIIIEFFFFVGLFNRTARTLFAFSAFFMHVGINLVIGAHGNFTPYLVCFVFWIRWSLILSWLAQAAIFLKIATLKFFKTARYCLFKGIDFITAFLRDGAIAAGRWVFRLPITLVLLGSLFFVNQNILWLNLVPAYLLAEVTTYFAKLGNGKMRALLILAVTTLFGLLIHFQYEYSDFLKNVVSSALGALVCITVYHVRSARPLFVSGWKTGAWSDAIIRAAFVPSMLFGAEIAFQTNYFLKLLPAYLLWEMRFAIVASLSLSSKNWWGGTALLVALAGLYLIAPLEITVRTVIIYLLMELTVAGYAFFIEKREKRGSIKQTPSP